MELVYSEESLVKNIISNGIGWELFSRDGRSVNTVGVIKVINVTDEELMLIERIADRVISDLFK